MVVATRARSTRASSLAGKGGGVAPDASAQRSERFGQDYGVWLKEWRQLQRSVFVLDRADRIVYVEYVDDQLREPDSLAALQPAAHRRSKAGRSTTNERPRAKSTGGF